MTKPIILIAACASSTIVLTGCSSTPHQVAHRVIDDATHELVLYQAAGQVAGDIGAVSFGALGFLNNVFRPSLEAASTCVNGLGQKVNCDTKEPIQE